MEKYDIFISYSRKDTEVVNKICNALESANISYFIDRKGIYGGMEFPLVIANAICNSSLFLFIASKNSYESKFTNSEITFAFNKKLPQSIIPYIIDATELPIHLSFIFSSINWRNIKEHPIESVLINDLCYLLDKSKSEYNKKTHNKFNTTYIIGDNCVACGTCQSICPTDSITEGDIYHINPDTCIECGSCAQVCPGDAIYEG